MMQEVAVFQGHSPCRVSVLQDDGDYKFVLKKATDSSYNARLREQFEKQDWFARQAQRIPLFRVPSVIEKGTCDNDLFYFSMDYIEGEPVIKYLATCTPAQAEALANQIADILRYFRQTEHPTGMSFYKACYDKVQSLGKSQRVPDHAYQAMIKFLENNKGKFQGVPLSVLHGDFTLENMIMDKHGNICLIDFLNVFYDHWLLDVSKVYQDVEAEWCKIKHGIQLMPKVKNAFLRMFEKRIEEMHPGYAQIHDFLLCMTMARILPYTKSKEMLAQVRAVVDYYTEAISE